jgi:DNA primase
VAVVTSRTQPNEKPSRDETLIDGRVRVAELEDALGVAVSYYQDQLDHNDEARAFLEARGMVKESAERWQVGYAPPRWDGLVNSLRSQGVSEEILVKAGLAGRARTGRVYDRMRGRIIFP